MKFVISAILIALNLPLYSQGFIETDFGFSDINRGEFSWVDIDNDNDLDLFVFGNTDSTYYIETTQKTYSHRPTTEIYINNGSGDYVMNEAMTNTIIDAYYRTHKWYDFNNDGYEDLIFTASYEGLVKTYFYKNNEGNEFIEEDLGGQLPVLYGNLSWGDFDNDGDMDLLTAGYKEGNSADRLTIVYENKGPQGYEQYYTVTSYIEGHTDWLDLDNDGDLDFILVGADFNGNGKIVIVENTGDGIFSERDITPDWVSPSLVKPGDYDNDGDIDLLIPGSAIFGVLVNNGNMNFNHVEFDFEVQGSPIDWFDADNDGDLDIFYERTIYVDTSNIGILENDHTGFIFNQDFYMKGISFNLNGVSFADVDADTNMDIILDNTAWSSLDSFKTVVYINQGTQAQTPPGAVTGIDSETRLHETVLSWDPPISTENYTYNLWLGSNNSTPDLISPRSDYNSGYRRIQEPGNISANNSWKIKGLPPGTYFWSVQAINQNYVGGSFSPIDSFEVLPPFTPMLTTENYIYSAAAGDMDNDGDVDIILAGPQFDGSGYAVTMFENEGDFSFTEKDISIDYNLTNTLILRLADYNNDLEIDILLDGVEDGNSNFSVYKNYGSSFSRVFSYSGLNSDYADWVDIDADGDLDISFGKSIFENKPGDSFEEKEMFIPHNHSLSTYFDMDNDGDQDYYFGGFEVDDGSWVNGIYENLGEWNFSLRDDIELKKITGSNTTSNVFSVDYNLDGLLDLLVSGTTENGNYVSILFTNDEDDDFTQNDFLLRKQALAFIDYNGDHYPDIQFEHNYMSINKQGDGTFEEFDSEVDPFKTVWADFDNDGDLDFLDTWSSAIYRNNGNWELDDFSSPVNMKKENNAYGVLLSWDQPEGSGEFLSGLSYNVRVGTTPGAYDIVAPFSNPISGYQRLPQMGNAHISKTFRLDSLPVGTYYWSVQAVDQSFRGGAWSEEHSFEIGNVRIDFSADTVCYGNETKFTDNSIGNIVSWEWDFGDGGKSTSQHPEYIFTKPGLHEVTLKVFSSTESTSQTEIVNVYPAAVADFDFEVVSIGEHTPLLNLTNTEGLSGLSWNWDFGDGNSFTEESPKLHKYQSVGDYNVSLQVISDNGCVSEIMKTVSVCEEALKKPEIVGAGPSIIYLVSSNDSASYYRWFHDGQLVHEATDHIYIPKKGTGICRVEISSGGVCYTSSEEFNLSLINSVSEHSFSYSLRVYPNPAQGQINVEYLDSPVGTLIIKIRNVIGQEILNMEYSKDSELFSTQIDIGNQVPGIYFIELFIDNNHKISKLVID